MNRIFWIAPVAVLTGTLIGDVVPFLYPLPEIYDFCSKLVICPCCAYLACCLGAKKDYAYACAFVLLALLYNPLVPDLYDPQGFNALHWDLGVFDPLTAILFVYKRHVLPSAGKEVAAPG